VPLNRAWGFKSPLRHQGTTTKVLVTASFEHRVQLVRNPVCPRFVIPVVRRGAWVTEPPSNSADAVPDRHIGDGRRWAGAHSAPILIGMIVVETRPGTTTKEA